MTTVLPRHSTGLLLTLIIILPTLVEALSSSHECLSDRNFSGLPILSSTANCSISADCNDTDTSGKIPLYFLVMAPYPDCSPFNPSWEGGPAVVPAAIVAKDLINQRDDILRDYKVELVISDSGCNISTKAVNSLIHGLFYSDRNVVGIIGPGCSEAALAIAPLVSDGKMSLIQIAPTATSPSLTDTSIYPNTFRPIVSALGFVNFQLSLIKQKNYFHIGALYEIGRAFQSTVYGHFARRVMGIGVKLKSFGLLNGYFPLKEFHSRVRVIFVFASTDFARQVLCAAIVEGLLYPDYQFIFSNRRPTDFFNTNVSFIKDRVRHNCNETEITQATRGMVFTNFRLMRQDRDNMMTNAGISYNQYSDIYEKERKCHLQSIDLKELINTPHQSNYFDATWALALSLNNSLPRLQEMGLSLSNCTYQMPETTEIVREEILNLRFEGMRGRVQFSRETHDGAEVTIIDIYQVSEGNNYGLIGFLDPLNSPDIKLLQNASLIPGYFDRRPHILFGIIITIVVSVLFVALLSCQIANVVWRNHKYVKATSPKLNHLMFLGCYLSLVTAIFYTSIVVFIDITVIAENNVLVPVHCSALQWSCTMMYSLVFGTLCAKRWRIHRIFSSFRATPVKYASDRVLILIALFPLVIDVVMNTLWNSIDSWQFDIEQSVICQTRNELIWVICVAVPKVVLTIIVLYLTIATRRVHKKEFKQTKSITILIYSLVILTGIFLPIFFILQTATSSMSSKWLTTISYLIFCIFDIGFVVLCIILVLLPPLIPSVREKLLKRQKPETQQLHYLTKPLLSMETTMTICALLHSIIQAHENSGQCIENNHLYISRRRTLKIAYLAPFVVAMSKLRFVECLMFSSKVKVWLM